MGTKAPITITESWQLISSGASFVEVKTAVPIQVCIAASAPSQASEAYHEVRAGNPLSYPGSENVYARTESGTASRIVVTEVVVSGVVQ